MSAGMNVCVESDSLWWQGWGYKSEHATAQKGMLPWSQIFINIKQCLECSLHLGALSAFELQGKFRSMVVLEQIFIVLQAAEHRAAINVLPLMFECRLTA